jgi:GGDEF domain-containing protein
MEGSSKATRGLLQRGLEWLRPKLDQEEREAQARGVIDGVTGLYNLPGFHWRLVEETARAERHRRELAVVVFLLAMPPPKRWLLRRDLEMALRNGARKSDIPARLSKSMLAVALPETGDGAATAAGRVGALLSQVAGCPIPSGYAIFPTDGTQVSDLLRTARERARASAEALSAVPESEEEEAAPALEPQELLPDTG